MSLNWVLLDSPATGSASSLPFIPLPEETVISCHSAVGLNLESVTTNNTIRPPAGGGADQEVPPPVKLEVKDGKAWVTSRRIIYLPTSPTPSFRSFSAPLRNLRNPNLTQPWFAPLSFSSSVLPTPGGGLPPPSANFRCTFREGGAEVFFRGVVGAMERARNEGLGVVEVDPVPEYEERQGTSALQSEAIGTTTAEENEGEEGTAEEEGSKRRRADVLHDDAPPGYDEVVR
ncbi:hypothetical protein SAICODRAFT_7105 [Saitoella complicata NRRL Y-17804]|nr:uncharacterized protein SAICODRAFT_7105 [Saitoella complicata NRRL Y-17804]ODQ53386.1 hypothetical protein SAICODRAFT_7105 [Saitoella complicata NRRL Y-17804]